MYNAQNKNAQVAMRKTSSDENRHRWSTKVPHGREKTN